MKSTQTGCFDQGLTCVVHFQEFSLSLMSASSLSTVLHVTQDWLMAPTKSRLFSGPQALSDLASARFSAVVSCNIQSYKPILQPKPQYILLFPK